MAQLLVRNQVYHLNKRLITVGHRPQYDVFIASDQKTSLLFSLSYCAEKNGRYEIHPSHVRLRVNGQLIRKATLLCSCDRIEWEGGAAVYTEASLGAESAETKESLSHQALEILHRLSATLHDGATVSSALNQALSSLVEMAGAETGYLLVESGAESEWKLVATQRDLSESDLTKTAVPSRAEFLSDTLLREAIAKRVPVCIESIVGHPLASSESIILSKIFSAACIPLSIEGRVFGAVFLLSRTPGKSIRKNTLSVLDLLGTQIGLLMSSQVELIKIRKEKSKQVPSASSLIYDRDNSIEMIELEKKLSKLASTPLSVLILGETGTGKEKIAVELHRRYDTFSGRSSPFVAVNCAAIPATLLESTLFGVEKGAFTGAIKSQPGKFLQANGGTVFLDEIGDLSLDLQAKLLRVLQEKKVEPVGSTESISVDVKIVSATHQNLEKLVEEGRFRQDLYFRLCGSSLKLPSLRQRRCDILPLAEYFISKLNLSVSISEEAQKALLEYSFPGNIRELENMITRAAFLTESEEIQVSDLEMNHSTPEFQSNSSIELLPLDEAQLHFTQEYVQKVLEKHQNNRFQTALFLGISERTLYRILSSARS